ncbi:MAG: HPr-rel-A system PqqD family peptide chaperone [Thiobacillaceae bacterium]
MARFQIKCFDHEAVVFDTASGDTHYLAPLAHALYTTSRDQPGISPHEMTTILAGLFETEPDSHFSQLTSQAMSSLQSIGLLETP